MSEETNTPDKLSEERVEETQATLDAADTEADQMPEESLDELQVKINELAEMKEKYLRLYADFENFRRRTAKEKLDLLNNGHAELLKAILPIVDDFERAMQSFETADDLVALKEGVELIYTKFTKTLEAKGLRPMEAKGHVFDADLHESVTQFPAPTDDLKGKVVDEIEKGYFLHDKVLRYAKVVVGA